MRLPAISSFSIRNNKIACYSLGIMAGVVALYTRALLAPIVGTNSPYYTVWAAIVFSASYCRLIPCIVTSVLCIAGVCYWFLPPAYSTQLYSPEIFQVTGFVLVSGFMVFIGEMTRRSEAKVEHTKNLSEVFLDNSSTTAFIKDASGGYLLYNRTLSKRFKVGDELLKRTDAEIFEKREAWTQNGQQVLEAGQCQRFVEHGEGEDRWLSFRFPLPDKKGRSLLGGISIDITEQKKTEAELRQAREVRPLVLECGAQSL